MQTLSQQIRDCRAGATDNPFQGKDKKVLFVCSLGILRSATAARLYAHKYNTRCCGTWDDALIPLTLRLIEWADLIVFVNRNNFNDAIGRFGPFYLSSTSPDIKVLDIPDNYEHMHPKLVEAFTTQFEAVD